jgi:putative ABC transport system ATP-binding protein
VIDLHIREVTVEYTQGSYTVRPIDCLSFSAQDGELVSLLGPSGSGKTTLLSCLAGLLQPTAGEIRVGSTRLGSLRGPDLAAYRRQQVGVVFQAFNLIPSLTARENVAVPLQLAGKPWRIARARAQELLDRVNLADRAHHRPAQLSGGQQQRVALARALVHDPPLIVADEPTAHLDHVQVEEVLGLIRGLAVPGRLVIVATHDERFSPLVDRVIDLAPRSAEDEDAAPRAVRLGPGEVLFDFGDRSDLVYVVEQGEVELYRPLTDGREELVARVGEGQYFGELGALLGLPRSTSARARGTCLLRGYGPRQFHRWTRTGKRV